MLQAQITYRGPLEGKVKGFGKAVKAALSSGVQHWHHQFLPEHFKPVAQASARYPNTYKPRGKVYSIRKAKKYHTQNALEYSGELKRNATRGVIVTGTKNEVRGRLPGSQKANFRRNASAPNMREELTATNQAEALALAHVVDHEVSEFLRSNEGTKTVVI